ncbi:MAG: GerMN domain-containing protein [Lachnospiraceae bacterium]|nr:GerMN domain-containing protein [Lachnospiraceae bacterium]
MLEYNTIWFFIDYEMSEMELVMRKKRFIAIFALLIILMLAACSNTTQNVTDAEDEELSSGEILANSLDYLLSGEDNDNVTDEEEDTEKIEVTVYYGNGASQELNNEITKMDELSAENLIDALGRHNIVSLGTKVNSFEAQDIDGVITLFLDLSKTFREYLKTMTKEGENVIISSVAATFLEAYGAEGIVITIDGDTLETGHAVYEEPIRYAPEQSLVPENE